MSFRKTVCIHKEAPYAPCQNAGALWEMCPVRPHLTRVGVIRCMWVPIDSCGCDSPGCDPQNSRSPEAHPGEKHPHAAKDTHTQRIAPTCIHTIEEGAGRVARGPSPATAGGSSPRAASRPCAQPPPLGRWHLCCLALPGLIRSGSYRGLGARLRSDLPDRRALGSHLPLPLAVCWMAPQGPPS